MHHFVSGLYLVLLPGDYGLAFKGAFSVIKVKQRSTSLSLSLSLTHTHFLFPPTVTTTRHVKAIHLLITSKALLKQFTTPCFPLFYFSSLSLSLSLSLSHLNSYNKPYKVSVST